MAASMPQMAGAGPMTAQQQLSQMPDGVSQPAQRNNALSTYIIQFIRNTPQNLMPWQMTPSSIHDRYQKIMLLYAQEPLLFTRVPADI